MTKSSTGAPRNEGRPSSSQRSSGTEKPAQKPAQKPVQKPAHNAALDPAKGEWATRNTIAGEKAVGVANSQSSADAHRSVSGRLQTSGRPIARSKPNPRASSRGGWGSRPMSSERKRNNPNRSAAVSTHAAASPQSNHAPIYASIGWRAWAVIAVAVMCLLIFVPSYVNWMTQSQKVAAAANDNTSSVAEYNRLYDQLKRWDDPSYIATQARARLQYVKPGEIPYRILDAQGNLVANPESAVDQIEQSKTPQSWYQKLWVSIEGADAAPRAVSLTPDKSNN